jgi:coenzyme A diphosphatase NUDT7
MPRVRHITSATPPELGPLKEDSLEALRSLSRYKPDPGSEPCPEAIPAYRRAAVLLGLFPGRNGELYVILSQRSTSLRSHGGDTAIPGGRFEASDADLEATAVSRLRRQSEKEHADK